jgi:MYXO-CTERM domain-containing protein
VAGGGCACRSTSPGSPGLLGLLGWFLLAWRRRRLHASEIHH